MENIKQSAKQKLGISAEKLAEELWSKLLNKLAEVKSEKEVRTILEKLISEYERKMILKRLSVIALVRSGKSYSEISEILWLTPNTISTIKKNILGNDGSYKSYRKFYGGPKKWSKDIKYEKPFWEDFNLLEFIDSMIPKYRGIGITHGTPAERAFGSRRKKK